MNKTLLKQLQEIVSDYIAAGEPWPASARAIAEWAIRKKRWSPSPSFVIQQCAEQLAGAMREEYIRDPQGRVVRAKHAARFGGGSKQMVLWADMRTSSRVHMEISLKQRRQAIVGDCRQLKIDVDSYNQNYNPGKSIQVPFDFTRDLEERSTA